MITLPGLIRQSPGTAAKQIAKIAENWSTGCRGLLKLIFVPNEQECCHRQMVHRRRRLIGDWIRVQDLSLDNCFLKEAAKGDF